MKRLTTSADLFANRPRFARRRDGGSQYRHRKRRLPPRCILPAFCPCQQTLSSMHESQSQRLGQYGCTNSFVRVKKTRPRRDLGETFPLQRARGPFLVQVTRYLRHCHIHLHTGSPLHSTNGNVPCAALRKRRFSTKYYAMMSLSCAGLPSASDLQLLQWLNR